MIVRYVIAGVLVGTVLATPVVLALRGERETPAEFSPAYLLRPGGGELSSGTTEWAKLDPALAARLAIRSDSTRRAKAILEIKRAEQLTDRKQYDSAIAAYRTASELLPSLSDWITVFSAGVSARAGDSVAVQRRTAGLDSMLLRDWVWRSAVRAQREAGNPVRAVQLATAAGGKLDSPRLKAQAWTMVGEVQLELGDTAAARKAFVTALDEGPLTDTALEAARLLSGLPRLTAREHLRIGQIYLAFGNQTRGVNSLQRFLDAKTGDAAKEREVRLQISRAWFNSGKYADAERVFKRVAAQSSGNTAAEALFQAGRAQYRRGAAEQGVSTFRTVAERYPATPAAVKALFMLGDLSHDAAEDVQARKYYETAISRAPENEYAGMAFMRLGAMAMAARHPADAERIFRDYAAAHTGGARHQQAVYWQARAQLAAGDQQQGRATLRRTRDLDPFSYYGMRAAELLEEPVIAKQLAPAPPTGAQVQRTVAAALDRYDVLREVGWTQAASYELTRVRTMFRDAPAAQYELAEGLIGRQLTTTGISVGRELLRNAGAWNERLLRIIYPLPFEQSIVAYARSHGIDPYFMAALIRQESMFNPTATSPAGAIGLMQVMPPTGRVIARSLGISGFTSAMLKQPELNLRLGSKYLADQIQAYDGRPDYVLAAYNAGPSRVARWRTFPEAVDPDLFMERIPFEETRDYVRIVQLNARIYTTLYDAENSGPTEAR